MSHASRNNFWDLEIRSTADPFNLSGTDFEHGCAVGDFGEERRVGAGHPHLRPKFGEFAMQCAAPPGIEMRDYFVKQEHRCRTGHFRD